MDNKIRIPVIWFSFFIALMLFQTSYMNLGTITAFGTLSIAIITSFSHKMVNFRSFYFPRECGFLLLFYIMATASILINGDFPSFFGRFSAQIILCVMFLAARPKVNRKEEKYLYNVFVLAALLYAILTIWSCIRLGSLRYYHARIEIFGTRLDPNYIGLPFIVAATLFLGKVLGERKKIVWLLGYTICVSAIVFTASRGNTVSLIASNVCVIIYSIFMRETSVKKKMIFIVAVLIVGCLAIRYFSTNLSLQWARITTYEYSSDNGRFVLWKKAIESWKDKPLLGHGLGGMYKIYGKATHNTYLELLSETGFLGSVFFVAFMASMIKRTFYYDKIMFCALIGMLIHISLLDSIDNRCVWVLLCWIALMPEAKHIRKEREIERNDKTLTF